MYGQRDTSPYVSWRWYVLKLGNERIVKRSKDIPWDIWYRVLHLPIQGDGFCDDEDLETIARLVTSEREVTNRLLAALKVAWSRRPDHIDTEWESIKEAIDMAEVRHGEVSNGNG